MNSFALQAPAYRWAISLGIGSGLAGPQADAAPQGMAVMTGSARVVVAGLRTEVSISDRALLQWNQFNVAAKESVIFHQPSSSSIVWNQIAAGNPSQIFGRIEANGIVVLANPSGFWFGPSSFVQAASFVATTALAPPPSFDTSGAWSSQLAPPSAGIVNYGQIEAGPGGSVYLLAQQVENHGTVSAPQGTVGLQAGQEVLISERADGRGLSTKVKLPAGIVDNLGHLTAAAGRILMEARVVNQAGIVEANSVRGQAGSIELLAEGTVALAEGSKTVAQGDGLGASPGGHILIRSEHRYSDSMGAQVSVAGGGAGGNGGDIEISAPELPAITAQVGGQAASGSSAGRLLIDPDSIVVDSTGVSTSPSGTVNAGQSPTRLVFQPEAFAAFSKILLQARKTIDINSLWNLPDAAGASASLTLESGGDLRIGANGGVSAGAGWAVTLRAGSLLDGTDEVVRGVGSILFNAGSSISAQDGSIHLSAGKDVTVQRGFVRTVAGGEISVRAAGGTITTGTKPDGFQFRTGDVGYDVNPGLGGMSTAAGGDVKLTAGKDVISYLPILMGNHTDGGSGAFGEAPGDVTIQAGGGVYGHFVVRHGQGKIVAEGSAGVANRQLALSLVQGSWTVSALDIALQEVRNPNGVFNRVGGPATPTYHLFDYDPLASVKLVAQNQVQLIGGGLPRNSGESALPSFYPPNLTITAGAGGVLLGNAVTLFPSPTGQFDLTTTEGGDFRSRDPGKLYNFTVSDSAAKQYTFVNGQFGPSDHASVPLHLADLEPARVSVSGSLEEIVLSFPKSAKVQVGGNLVNAGLLTQNLHGNDVTRLEVAGDIRNRNDYTFVTLPPGVLPPDLELQNLAEPALPISLFYDSATRQIGLRGRMSEDALAALLALQIRVIDGVGNPTFNPDGTLITVAAQLIPAAVAQELFAKSGDVPQRPPVGYQVGGGGKFEVRARNLDLGVTAGILSVGSAANAALGSLGSKGADLSIRVEKDLVLFSSAIISKAGGTLQVEAGHEIQAGSSLVLPVSDGARGIYSSAGSDVMVQAGGNILLNGSRIAAYDGGKVTVRSTGGNIDAGSGGLSLQAVEQVRVNPTTGETSIKTDFIPGSGILATTFASGSAEVGDILVEAPRGDILARAGGVVQAPLNGTGNRSGKVQLTAGTKPSDGESGFIGRIDASKSGVIGGNVSLDATGPIIGVVFASGNINIATPQAVNVTALAQGGVSVAAGGSISGTLVGVGSVTATGSSVDAALVSQNVSGSPGATAAVTASVATAASQSASAQATQSTPASKVTTDDADEEARRLASRKPVLVRTVGRVKVLLPDATRSN